MKEKKTRKKLPRENKRTLGKETSSPKIDPTEAALRVQRSVENELQRVAGPNGKVQAPPALLRFIAVRPELHPPELPLTFW